MSRNKLRLLAGVSALMAPSALNAASANATTVLQGGGSTLLAPYWTQAANCWDDDTTAIGNDHYVKRGLPGAANRTLEEKRVYSRRSIPRPRVGDVASK